MSKFLFHSINAPPATKLHESSQVIAHENINAAILIALLIESPREPIILIKTFVPLLKRSFFQIFNRKLRDRLQI